MYFLLLCKIPGRRYLLKLVFWVKYSLMFFSLFITDRIG